MGRGIKLYKAGAKRKGSMHLDTLANLKLIGQNGPTKKQNCSKLAKHELGWLK